MARAPEACVIAGQSHQRAIKHVNAVFGDRTLTEVPADLIEGYLRQRWRRR
jgi:hypothetical protein